MFWTYKRRSPNRYFLMFLVLMPVVFYVLRVNRAPIKKALFSRAHMDLRPSETSKPHSSKSAAVISQEAKIKPDAKIEPEVKIEPDAEKPTFIRMETCPDGWLLEVGLPQPNVDTPSQVCRNMNGTGEWICAPGWEQLSHHPYCQMTRNGPECSAVSDKNKLLFVNIPHAGGTAVERSSLFKDNPQSESAKCRSGSHHYSISAFDPAAFQGYHKFTVVRHPCARLISIWRQLSSGENVDGYLKTWIELHLDDESRSSFSSFVEKVLYPGGDVHIQGEEFLKSQVSMIFNKEEKLGLDQVMYFERWDEGVDRLAKRLVDNGSLKSELQPTNPKEDCSAMYTDATWYKVKSLYAMDFCVLGYSPDLKEVNKVPSADPAVISSRYQKCKEEVAKAHLPFVDSYYKEDKVNNDCYINTYFVLTSDSTPEAKLEKEEILAFWKKSWAAMGWTPRILSEDNARSHPAYQKYSETFWGYPRVHPREYGYNNLIRHLAMANVGGGYMADSDVLPLRIHGCTLPLNNGSFTVYQRFIPGLVSGNASEYFRVVTQMATVDWKSFPKVFKVEGKDHVSDMYCLLKFMEDGSIKTELNVETAQKIFHTPFNCNNTKMTPSYQKTLVERGWTPLSAAAHFSYDALQTLKKKDPEMLEKFWNSYEGSESIEKFQTSRVFLMKVVNDFFHKMCPA